MKQRRTEQKQGNASNAFHRQWTKTVSASKTHQKEYITLFTSRVKQSPRAGRIIPHGNYRIMNGYPLTIRKQPSGESFWIHVEPNYRISTCKQKIQRMRGIPASNIRLAMPNAGRESVSLVPDDYQQRTLASLGLVGTESTDSESDDIENGPILELAPITLYIQTPSGRRIKLKDCIDV